MRLPKLPTIPKEIPYAIGALFTGYTVLSILPNVPLLLGLPTEVLMLLGMVVILVMAAGIIVGLRRDLAAATRDATDRAVAIGDVIKQGQLLDAAICRLKGEDKREPGAHADRLNDFHADAIAIVRKHWAHREGYYLSDANLANSMTDMSGWRDVYVSEIRRRVLRLNELQRDDR